MENRKEVPSLISLKKIIENTSAVTGKRFFKTLVKHLAEVLDVHGVWITEYYPETNKFNVLAFWLDGDYVDKYEYSVSGTPCELVLKSPTICHIPENVIQLFPNDPDLKPIGAKSYLGFPLIDNHGLFIGHLALLDNKPMPEIPEVFAIFQLFASRAGAELRREIAQRKIAESQSKLNRLVNGTLDAIIELNSKLKVTQCNRASSNMFDINESNFQELSLKVLFDSKSLYTLKSVISQNKNLINMHDSFQIREPLVCLNNNGKSFPSEVNLSCYESDGEIYYVLYIRNIKDQVLDKIKIKELNAEANMLKEKIEVQQFNYIIGNSEPIKKCLELVNQVALTDSNVLILGETGTGKELFAKAVHEASSRESQQMITLNCAALPAELIESELFGHVKGAFTGAVTSREGRFSMADKGTIFLDEIAELPLTLQAKLLRVIQEGTFEPVGSSETKKVDIRIIAATHRNLKAQVENGKFREDLYYRLNVFPLSIPPLRDRGKDIELIAKAFLKKFVKNKAISVMPLSRVNINMLYTYHWPGNVRELQNIIERGIITSRNGIFNMEGTLSSRSDQKITTPPNLKILTFDEMKHIEKENIIKALNTTNWKISGEGGAADILKIPRTTLTSKIKKLKIRRVAVG